MMSKVDKELWTKFVRRIKATPVGIDYNALDKAEPVEFAASRVIIKCAPALEASIARDAPALVWRATLIGIFDKLPRVTFEITRRLDCKISPTAHDLLHDRAHKTGADMATVLDDAIRFAFGADADPWTHVDDGLPKPGVRVLCFCVTPVTGRGGGKPVPDSLRSGHIGDDGLWHKPAQGAAEGAKLHNTSQHVIAWRTLPSMPVHLLPEATIKASAKAVSGKANGKPAGLPVFDAILPGLRS